MADDAVLNAEAGPADASEGQEYAAGLSVSRADMGLSAPPGDVSGAVATNRFGMGARPGEIETASSDPVRYLRDQVRASGGPALPELTGSKAAYRTVITYQEVIRRAQDGDYDDPDAVVAAAQQDLVRPRLEHTFARTRLAAMTADSFAERWVRFWSNHFSVSAVGGDMIPTAATLEAEAIRPNAFKRFDELALAADLHIAMLLYLDNIFSIGPNSPAGSTFGVGMNENLAREILELHTIGVEGGYRQSDVEAFARALTGWTVGNPRIHPEARWGEALFDERLHEPGPQTVMGVTYADTGADQARAILSNLAQHPAIARRMAEKLARHFFSDQPSKPQIRHIERAWRWSGGDLAVVARALASVPDAFDMAPVKFKPPEEYVISALRALDASMLSFGELMTTFQAIGQAPFSAPSPEGWPDDESSWANPDAIKKRLEYVNALARQLGGDGEPLMRGYSALGHRLDPDTELAVSRAESELQGLTLLLMAPDFLRR
ncbi:MAG: DUF1800 family protein [Pseudomonadota bacterium]